MDTDRALCKSLLGVVSEAWDRNMLNAPSSVAVEGPLESVLEEVDHDALNIPVNSGLALFEICLVGQEIMK